MVAWTRTLRAWSGSTNLCWPCGKLPVADYLVVGRRVRWEEAVIHSSTLICETVGGRDAMASDQHPRRLGLAVATRLRDNAYAILAEVPLANVIETPEAASPSVKWRETRPGARRHGMTKRRPADVLHCTTAPHARSAGDGRAVARIARLAVLLLSPVITRLARGVPASLWPEPR